MIQPYQRSENRVDIHLYSASRFLTRMLVAVACVVGVGGFWYVCVLFLLALYRHLGGQW